VVSCNLLAGRLDDKNRVVMAFPEGLYSMEKPYYEASAGIENIFKFLRVDGMWRFSYLDHDHVQKFGIRATMQFSF